MKKKLIYSILFVSLFLISTASMVQPVQGYDYNIPAEAKGHEVEATLDVYDEDEWDNHLGAGVDRKGLKDGDSDVVGAKDKYKILEWEKDEGLIDYLDDFVLGPADIPTAAAQIQGILQSMAFNLSTWEPGTYGPIGFIANYSLDLVDNIPVNPGVWSVSPTMQLVTPSILAIAAGANLEFIDAIDSYEDMMARYSTDYDGLIMTREKWEFTDEEFDDDPDDDDNEVPFFFDPRDWDDVAGKLAGFANEISQEVDSIQQYWAATSGWYQNLLLASLTTLSGGINPGALNPVNWDFSLYEAMNASIADQISRIPPDINTFTLANYEIFGDCKPHTLNMSTALLGLMGGSSDPPYQAFMAFAQDIADLISAPLQYTIDTYIEPLKGLNNYSMDFVQGLMGVGDLVLETIYQRINALIPDKAGFFLAQLIAGQPAASPSEDFMAKVLEVYDINDEVLSDMYKFQYGEDISDEYGCSNGEVSDIPVGAVSRFTGTDLGGETIYPQAYMDFSVEGDVVTVEIDWADDYIDPKDRTVFGGDNEDELKDFEIVFGGSNVWKDGDEIFWQTSPVEAIPGYEITILLGASAISVLALVYVIMKKRKK